MPDHISDKQLKKKSVFHHSVQDEGNLHYSQDNKEVTHKAAFAEP